MHLVCSALEQSARAPSKRKAVAKRGSTLEVRTVLASRRRWVHVNELRQRGRAGLLCVVAIKPSPTTLACSPYPPESQVFTWWPPWRNQREKNVGWRVDFVLLAESLAKTMTSCVVRKDVLGSDHAPVVVEIG